MNKKIYGITVGTTLNPSSLEKKLKPVKTVNGHAPDANGNVTLEIDSAYTPQKGVDYWTAEDIAEIKSYVEDAILGGAW